MLRRTLIAGAAGLPLLSRFATAQTPVPTQPSPDWRQDGRQDWHQGWRRFEIRTEIALDAGGEAATLWLPLAQTAGTYQRAAEPQLTTNGTAARVADERYGAAMIRIAFPAGVAPTATLVQAVSTRPRTAEPAALSAADRLFWTAPTESVPTDGIVQETARRIVGSLQDPAAQARALYDWVVDNTFRDGATRGCGTGDIKSMLETGWLGGKCADINSLMTGLARACGIPARDVYGIRVAPSGFSRSLGAAASGDITRAQHCRTELWIDEARGWMPVDPADVRKVVLEEGAPVDSDHVRQQRERLFGQWEMNWVGFNSATDLVLPGAPRVLANFLMYPCAVVGAAEKDCLDPASFRYAIGARQLPA